MALKPYKVEINGHKTTLLLSEEDARKQGLIKAAEPKAAPAPANKARKPANKKKG